MTVFGGTQTREPLAPSRLSAQYHGLRTRGVRFFVYLATFQIPVRGVPTRFTHPLNFTPVILWIHGGNHDPHHRLLGSGAQRSTAFVLVTVVLLAGGRFISDSTRHFVLVLVARCCAARGAWLATCAGRSRSTGRSDYIGEIPRPPPSRLPTKCQFDDAAVLLLSAVAITLLGSLDSC